jgi:hypothetical protein
MGQGEKSTSTAALTVSIPPVGMRKSVQKVFGREELNAVAARRRHDTRREGGDYVVLIIQQGEGECGCRDGGGFCAEDGDA